MDRLLRHIAACDNARLPGARLAFRIGPTPVGWVLPELAATLLGLSEFCGEPGAVILAADAASSFPAIVRRLAGQGCFRWRNEAFDVRVTPGGPVLTQIDRGALPAFGVMAEGVHVNGLVRRPDGMQLCVARRAADKALDPGKLDHIVAAGIPAGLTAEETLVKEAAEEAAIPAGLAAQAIRIGRVGYAMGPPERPAAAVLTCSGLPFSCDMRSCATPHDVVASR